MRSSLLSPFRFWSAWKGQYPDPATVAFMNKNYPSDWTYADFAAQFKAEFYGIPSARFLFRSTLCFDRSEWMGWSLRCFGCQVSSLGDRWHTILLNFHLCRYIVLTTKVRLAQRKWSILVDFVSASSITTASLCGHRNTRTTGMPWMSVQSEISSVGVTVLVH